MNHSQPTIIYLMSRASWVHKPLRSELGSSLGVSRGIQVGRYPNLHSTDWSLWDALMLTQSRTPWKWRLIFFLRWWRSRTFFLTLACRLLCWRSLIYHWMTLQRKGTLLPRVQQPGFLLLVSCTVLICSSSSKRQAIPRPHCVSLI